MPDDTRRIGDKLVSRERIIKVVDEVLALRQAGLSQQDTAVRVGTDRTFVSRLESLGEIRKGARIAVIGFPVANKAELLEVAGRHGVDFSFILDDSERWSFLEQKSGLELFAEVVGLMETIRRHDVVIILGHNRPAQIIAALAERQAVVFQLAQIEGRPAWFSPAALSALIDQVKG